MSVKALSWGVLSVRARRCLVLLFSLAAAGCAAAEGPAVAIAPPPPPDASETPRARDSVQAFLATVPVSVTGSVTVDRTPIGSFDSRFTTCQSGSHQYFMGADLGGSGVALRVAIEVTGDPLVTVHKPGAPVGVKLTHENCGALDVLVEASGTRVDGGRLMSGRATFDCTLKVGGTVRGSVQFQNCR